MAAKEAIFMTEPKKPALLCQAVKSNGMVYCSGSVGMDVATGKLIEGSVGERAVRVYFLLRSGCLHAIMVLF